MNQVQVGQKVRELRTIAGMTQDELAVTSGLTVRSIQRIENGRTIPRGDSLKRLAAVLKVPIESLAAIRLVENAEAEGMVKDTSEVPAALILSAFGFLIHPVLGIIFPMLIWLVFRKKIDGVQELGLRIVRIEVYWCIVLACVNMYLLVKKIFHWNIPIPANVKTFAMLIIFLYSVNALMLAIFLVRWFSAKKNTFDLKDT